jgi:hypothetical protein
MKLNPKQISEVIIKMADEDQKARSEKDLDWKKIDIIDKENNKEIKKLINEYGLIGQKEYGIEASSKAWLLIQHMPQEELQFMKEYLRLMKENLNDIDVKNYAYLKDRLSMYEKTPQTYGTQLRSKDGSSDLKFHPIKDIKSIDQKRNEVGLDTLKDYAESMEKMYNQKVLLPKGYSSN